LLGKKDLPLISCYQSILKDASGLVEKNELIKKARESSGAETEKKDADKVEHLASDQVDEKYLDDLLTFSFPDMPASSASALVLSEVMKPCLQVVTTTRLTTEFFALCDSVVQYSPKAFIANPATTLLNELDSFTCSAPKIFANVPVNNEIFDDPPVLIHAILFFSLTSTFESVNVDSHILIDQFDCNKRIIIFDDRFGDDISDFVFIP
jgi:hypothetical protein